MRKRIFALTILGTLSPALAQTAPQPANGSVPAVPSPFQALGNVLRNPEAPPPQPPPTVTNRSLALPAAIPPNTVGTGR